MELINYSESLAKHIRTLFIRVIVPENFLLAVHKHNLDVLTDADIARLRKKLATNISLDVNMDLLDLLCRYKEWFDCVLKVLGDPEIKQQSYVPEFEKLKCEHDIQWNSKKSEKCDESIVCQATDNRSLQSLPDENSSLQSHFDENPVLESQLNENSSLQSEPDTNSFLQSEPDPNSSLHYQSASQPDENSSLLNLPVGNPSFQSETDGNNPSLQSQATGIQGEMNEPLDGTVINNSLTTDSVDTMMGNLTIIEGKGWSMSGGKGKCPTYCQVCELSLTSPQHAEQHYSGKNHKKKVELNTSQDQGGALSNETESPTYCQVCDLTLTSPRHAEQHYSGKNHKKKVELNTSQDQGGALSNETESPTYCQVCELTLTSPQHAEQHYSGRNHKKKVDALKINISDISTNDSEIVDNAIYKLDANGIGLCKACNVSLTSKQNAKQHLDGRSHQKKLQQNNTPHI